MADKKTRLFAECMKCGARWHVGMLPMGVPELSRVGRHAMCPYCYERKAIGLCATSGADAVTEPRDPVKGGAA